MPAATKNETRAARINLAVTPEEKRAARAVAAATGERDHSLLLRSMSLDEIIARYAAIKKASAS